MVLFRPSLVVLFHPSLMVLFRPSLRQFLFQVFKYSFIWVKCLIGGKFKCVVLVSSLVLLESNVWLGVSLSVSSLSWEFGVSLSKSEKEKGQACCSGEELFSNVSCSLSVSLLSVSLFCLLSVSGFFSGVIVLMSCENRRSPGNRALQRDYLNFSALLQSLLTTMCTLQTLPP